MKLPYISVNKNLICKKCGEKEWELIYVNLKLKQVVIVCSNCGEEIKITNKHFQFSVSFIIFNE